MTVSFDFENDFSVALFFLAVNVITWVRFRFSSYFCSKDWKLNCFFCFFSGNFENHLDGDVQHEGEFNCAMCKCCNCDINIVLTSSKQIPLTLKTIFPLPCFFLAVNVITWVRFRFSSYFCSKDWKLNCFYYFYFKIFIFKEMSFMIFLSCRHMWCEVVHIICKKWFFVFM
jgi:hypothetical protein